MSGSQAPFETRHLSVELRIPQGVKRLNYHTGQLELSEAAGQTISLQGHRITANINDAGQVQAVSAQLQIYNVNQTLMRSLCGFGSMGIFNFSANSADDLAASVNVPTLYIFRSTQTYQTAGKTTAGKADLKSNLIYKGSLFNVSAQMRGAPDPFITIESYTLGAARLQQAQAMSYKGAVPATTLAQTIANIMGLSFENNGVSTILENPYFAGDAATQLRDLAEQALFNFSTSNGTLSIWPVSSYRTPAGSTPVINSSNGLLDYPEFNGVGVTFRTIYMPSIRFGDLIKLESIVPNVTGYYTVTNVSHHLSQQLPGGPWESQIQATFMRNPIGTATL